MLWAISADEGTALAEQRLDAPPAFDGMAAAGGHLFVGDTGGQVTCFGHAE